MTTAQPNWGPGTVGLLGPLLGFLLVTLLAVSAVASVPQAKTLTRFHDPVIVKTAVLTGLPARQTAGYRLYSAREGSLFPIPFQFDERDGKGEIVFHGIGDNGEFVFDDNDELVFMAKDTGDRIESVSLPSEADAAVEIEVTDPATGGNGWAYLLHFPTSPPPRSPVTYATFDPEASQARALFYTMDYAPGRNFFTGLRIQPEAGGTGENILDRMKVRVNPRFSLGLTTWSPLFTEEDIAVTIDGVKNGPVRAIRRVRQSLDLGRYIPAIPNGTTYTYFYFSSFVTPSTFHVPRLVLKLLDDFRFTGVSLFRKNAVGMEYWDAANPQGLRITGANNATVKTTEDHDWYVVSGKEGTHLQAFVIPEQWKQWGIVRGTVFQDADLAAGYSLLNMTNLREPGAYDMNLAVIMLPHPYRPGDEVEPLAMLSRPLVSRAQVMLYPPPACCLNSEGQARRDLRITHSAR